MTNRLRNLLRTFPCCVGLLLVLAYPSQISAQPGFFNFNYNGPDSLAVGVSCNIALLGNIPNPIVTSTIGANITVSMFSADSSNFQLTDTWSEGETAHVYWYVEDDMGHAHYFDFFIFFVDNSPPAFDLTGISDTLYFNSVVQVTDTPIIPILDNCSSFTLMYTETAPPDTCEAGEFTRTWTATDVQGNVGVFTQWIIIAADDTPPTISFGPQNGSSPCETLATTYPAWLAAQMAAFSASDPSGIKSLTNNGPASFPPGCKVPLTVTFKATDNCNFMSPTTAVFTTSDTEGPVIVVAPKDTIGYCAPNGNHLTKLNEWISTHAYMQVMDSCSAPLTYSMEINDLPADSAEVVAAFWASFDAACGQQQIGSNLVNKVSAKVEVKFLVTDACGNQTNAGLAIYGAVDTLPPVISGSNMTEQCGGGNDQTALQSWINNKAGATLADDCSAAFWTNFSYLTSTGLSGSGAFDFGPYPTVVANNCTWYVDVTFNASDECGNNAGKSHRFQIFDTQAPVFSGLVPNITVYCPSPLPTVPAATITDNCDASTDISFTRVYQDSICDGSYTVVTTWKATDDCGNTATVNQNIFVRDTTRPVFTLVPAGLLMRCDTFILPPVPTQGQNINATDLCSPVVSITTVTTSTQNPDPTRCDHYSYHYDRVFTATDECGNTQTATQLITVIDNQPPVPGGVLDTTALCSALSPFPAPIPLAFDLCSGPTIPPTALDSVVIPGACTGVFTIKRTWRAIDYCGNPTVFDQLIHVIDSIAPILSNIPPAITVECDAIPAPPNTVSFNGADNCAASVVVTLMETEIRNPDTTTCDHWANYVLRREWTASDDCGNERTYTQDIQITDTTPPTLEAPANITLGNDLDECGANITIPAPVAIADICATGLVSALLKDTLPITPITPPFSGTIPVDTIIFQITPPNTLPNEPAASNVMVITFIERADADGVTEYFKVFGEGGVLLGNTTQTPGLCSSTPGIDTFFFSAAQFNTWASDGVLTFTLAPNGVFGAAINPTCLNSQIRMNLSYDYEKPIVPIDLTYTLDGGPSMPFPPAGPTFLGVGTHTVVYTATDCSSNSSTATVQITVNDIQAPVITPPATLTTYVASGACLDTIVLPFPAIAENCNMSGYLNKSSVYTQIQFIDDPDFGDIPSSVVMGFSGAIPNAISDGTLRIKFKGDNANPREFFRLYNGATLIDSTDLGSFSGECFDTVITTIPVTAANINLWTASGNVAFHAEPNTDPGSPLDFDFINPCGALPPNSSSDGLSTMQVMLEYHYAIINFTITNNANAMIVATGALQGTQTMVPNLAPGNYTVKYSTTDAAGLMGMTTFPLIVLDTLKPIAKCKPGYFIAVNPSGLDDYVLQTAEINDGSTDNCPGNLSYSLSQDSFECEVAGTSTLVVLTVTDLAGNTATCSTSVFVQMDMPEPTHGAICEGDTLFLFANPPTPGNFLYAWSHPSGYTNNDPNPVRLNAQSSYQGVYTVRITGISGCTAEGSVSVNYANLTQPIFSVSGGNGTNFCQGQAVTLNASFPAGNVTYLWYQDAVPNPVLLGSTAINFLTLPNLPPGQYTYYVKVKVGDCLTPNSLAITINVFARPIASVVDNFIQICAGQPLALSTAVTGVSYNWAGPFGWSSNVQHPLVKDMVTEMQEGFYTLTTSKNGCISIPSAIVQVDVKYTPPQPLITGTTSVCAGTDVTLKANVASLFSPLQFQWQKSPAAPISTGNIDSLLISNVQPADCGNWRVQAFFENCPSPWSDEVSVCAEDYPDVTAAANSPICQDSTLTLMATGSNGIVDWSWIMPNNSIIYAQNPVITPGFPGLFRVVGRTSFGCTDTASVLVIGSTAPYIDTVDIIAPICQDGSPAVLIPTVTSFNGPFTYTWMHGAQTLVLTDPTFTIDPFGPANAGPYTLVVKDTFGCPSAPETVFLSVQPTVITPLLSIPDNAVCVGETAELVLTNNANDYQNATFYWIGPNDTLVTSVPQLFIPNITLSEGGNYTVYVQQGSCFSPLSTLQTLTVNPIPPAPNAGIDLYVCNGDDLALMVDPFVIGTTYHWTGPGYSVTGLNPIRANMTELFQGDYAVTAEKLGCISAPDTVNVQVMDLPKNAQIDPTDPDEICLEPINPNNFIRVLQSRRTDGALYTWINPATGDTLYGPSSDTSLNFIDLAIQQLTPGLHQFAVVAWLPEGSTGFGCSSAVSPTFSVQFDTIPFNTALCDADHPACSAQPVVLSANNPSGNLTGMWHQIPVPTVGITNPDSSVAKFLGVAGNTYTFVWALSNGGCKNFSTDTLEIIVSAPEFAFAGADTSICDDVNFSLNANDGIFTVGSWSQLNQFGVSIVDSFEAKTPITGMIPSNSYFFVWTLSDIGCGISDDTVQVNYFSAKPNITGITPVCSGDNEVLLKAPVLRNFETGMWDSQTHDLTFSEVNKEETIVKNLVPGPNVVYWTINNGICGSDSRDTFVVTYYIFPTANPDQVDVPFGTATTFQVLPNDILPAAPPSITIIVPPSNGTITGNPATGTYVYKPNAGFSGQDELVYRICNEECGPNACSSATVTFDVGEAGECYVPTIITPNGDGVNDFFQLPPECYLFGEGQDAKIEVTVFNQWGDYVFHKNSAEEPSGIIMWDGKFNGNQLPTGTYFYVVKFEGDPNPKSGFLLIQY